MDDFEGLLNWSNLQDWVGTSKLPGSGPVTAVEKLTGGSQNNIFLLTRGAESMVLRRPPARLRPNSNETMLREARVLGALEGSGVPAPNVFDSCADEAVIGTCFYVMQAIEGFTPMGELPGDYATDVAWRRSLGESMLDGAAALARVDPDAVGLSDFGKADNWIERQVGRWRSQLDGYSDMEGYTKPDLPGVDRVGDWLSANQPSDFRAGIIHGDYQHANVMARHDAPELAAIVDWELSTIGDPRLDLGWLLTAFYEEGDPEGRSGYCQPGDGFPTRAELVARYHDETGISVDDVDWWFTLACYKLGILLEGTNARAAAGKVPQALGDALHGVAVWLFAKANQLIDQA